MKPNFKITFLLLILNVFLISCDNRTPDDTTKLFATYKRDKFVAIDTTEYSKKTIDNSGGWTISLKSANKFTFRGTQKIVNGSWSVNKREGEDFFLNFISQKDTISARLNGSIIYFDEPYKLFDNLFKEVVFVQMTNSTE